MWKKRGRPATVAFLLATAAWSQLAPARAETLADALVTAVRTSPELAQARSNVKILAERAIQARSGGRIRANGLIDLSTDFNFSNRNGDFSNLNDNDLTYPTQMVLEVEQPIYTGGQVANATEAALTRMTAQEARVIATEQLVLLNAVQAYIDVQRDETLVELGENNVRVIGEQLRAAEERFDVGEVTRTDVAQAEARLAAARSLLAARIGALQVSREAFRRDVGVYPEDLDPVPPLPDVPDSLEQAVTIAFSEAPEILAARLERIAAGSDVRAAIGALLPQVSLAGQVGRVDVLGVERDSNADATLGVRVTLPFYNGGFNWSRVRESQALVEANEADIVTSMRDAAERVGTAWSDLRVSGAVIDAGQLEVEAAQIAFEGVREEAKVGARTTLDVLDAEQELLNARADLIVARRDEYFAAYALLFAIGKLSVEHLGLDTDDAVPPAGAYYAAVEDRDFGYDPTDDTVWTLSYRP
jgi:outer membrane protein